MLKQFLLLLQLQIVIIAVDYRNSQIKLFPTYNTKGSDGLTFDLLIEESSIAGSNICSENFNIFLGSPSDGCTPLAEPDFSLAKKTEESHISYLVSVQAEEGDCSLNRKIKNARSSGAKGVIILSKDLKDLNLPSSDGIPFFVFVASNLELIKELHQPLTFAALIVNTNQNNDKHIVQIFTSAMDPQSYEMLLVWNTIMQQIPSVEDRVTWSVRTAVQSCQDQGQQNQKQQGCICEGAICTPEVHNLKNANILQDITQKIIYTDFRMKYLEYMVNFRRICFDEFVRSGESDACSTQVQQNIGIDSFKVTSLRNQLSQYCSGYFYQSLLLDKSRFKQVTYFPAFTLDHQIVHFSSKQQLSVVLCRKLGIQNFSECHDVMQGDPAFIMRRVVFYGLIFVGVALIALVMLWCYRKKLRNFAEKQMKMQIESSVGYYYKLQDVKM